MTPQGIAAQIVARFAPNGEPIVLLVSLREAIASALTEATTRRDTLGVNLAEAQQRIFHLETALTEAQQERDEMEKLADKYAHLHSEEQLRVNDLKAALADARRDEGWQPIETAPKDRTRILVTNGEAVTVSWWAGDWWSTDWVPKFAAPGVPKKPTHWRPLPSPPSRQEEG